MNSSDINQLTGHCRAEFGTLSLADGRQVSFIELHLQYLRAGKQHSVPVLTMTPEQARLLAMYLLAAADKAPAEGKTPPAQLN